MEDLIIQYFKRPLNEAEADALGAKLELSVDEAARFASLAEAEYRRFGLPGPSSKRRKGAFWVWGLLGLATGAGLLAWLGSKNSPPVLLIAPEADATAFTAAEPVVSEKPKAEETKISVPSERPLPTRQASPQPTPVKAASEARLRIAAIQASDPGFEINLEQDPPRPAQALVRDRAGHALRLLGLSNSGRWHWDGRADDGKLCAPGVYGVEVSYEGGRRLKWVKLESR